MKTKHFCLLTMGFSLLTMQWGTATAAAAVHYVSAWSTNAIAPFSNWATAATRIQDAVNAASGGDTVLVTNGVYASGGEAVYGALTNRVAITKPVIVRSVNGPGATVISGRGPLGNGAIRGAYVTNGAALIGFTISNGFTRLSGDSTTERSGGGTWCEDGGTVSNCVFIGNAGRYGGGAYGGTVIDCVFTGNWASFSGGGAMATLYRCTLAGNAATNQGGGTYGATLYDCTVSGNRAQNSGGGAAWSTLYNCTVCDNWAQTEGGGLYEGGLYNSVVYYNAASGIDTNVSLTFGSAEFTCSAPLLEGDGNISAEPRLANRAGGDLRLAANSPCINAGTNDTVATATDLDGYPRISPFGGRVDMGAYEFQGAAPVAPAGLVASDGLYSNKVALTWTPVPYATGYAVWRYTNSNPALAAKILSTASAGTNDSGVSSGAVYFYWVKATNTLGSSAFSAPDTGYASSAASLSLVVGSARGMPSPPAGTNIFAGGSAIVCSLSGSPEVDGATQFVCTGWTGTGSVPAAGNATSVAILLTNHSSITWQWTPQYALTVSAGFGGSAVCSNGWYDAGMAPSATASSSNGFHFAGWSGDVDAGNTNDNPVTLVMDRTRSVTANFALNQYSIVATAGPGGSMAPNGTVWVAHGGGTNFVMMADAHNHVSGVTVDGAAVGETNQYAFGNVTNSHTIGAAFAENLAARGTPEWWLAFYGWTNDLDEAETNDADGDAMSTWQEYVAGTVPTDALSVLLMPLTVQGSAEEFVVRWWSASNRFYRVQRSTGTLDGFDLLTSGLPATPPENVYTDAIPDLPRAFYRIGVEPPPAGPPAP